MTNPWSLYAAALFAAAVATLAVACGETRSEGLDPQSLPADVRPEYAVFAERCSKCHSLARPLNSGIDDDEYWREYVAKMRRQPQSGISPDDATVILRFLHFFSIEERAKKAAAAKAKSEPEAPASPPGDASSAIAPAPSADGGT